MAACARRLRTRLVDAQQGAANLDTSLCHPWPQEGLQEQVAKLQHDLQKEQQQRDYWCVPGTGARRLLSAAARLEGCMAQTVWKSRRRGVCREARDTPLL